MLVDGNQGGGKNVLQLLVKSWVYINPSASAHPKNQYGHEHSPQ